MKPVTRIIPAMGLGVSMILLLGSCNYASNGSSQGGQPSSLESSSISDTNTNSPASEQNNAGPGVPIVPPIQTLPSQPAITEIATVDIIVSNQLRYTVKVMETGEITYTKGAKTRLLFTTTLPRIADWKASLAQMVTTMSPIPEVTDECGGQTVEGATEVQFNIRTASGLKPALRQGGCETKVWLASARMDDQVILQRLMSMRWMAESVEKFLASHSESELGIAYPAQAPIAEEKTTATNGFTTKIFSDGWIHHSITGLSDVRLSPLVVKIATFYASRVSPGPLVYDPSQGTRPPTPPGPNDFPIYLQIFAYTSQGQQIELFRQSGVVTPTFYNVIFNGGVVSGPSVTGPLYQIVAAARGVVY